MNILYCGDKNIQDGVLISVLSLMEQVREPLHVYLLTAGIRTKTRCFTPLPRAFAEFLEGLLREHDPESRVSLFDISALFAAQMPTANLETRFTPAVCSGSTPILWRSCRRSSCIWTTM